MTTSWETMDKLSYIGRLIRQNAVSPSCNFINFLNWRPVVGKLPKRSHCIILLFSFVVTNRPDYFLHILTGTATSSVSNNIYCVMLTPLTKSTPICQGSVHPFGPLWRRAFKQIAMCAC